MGAAIKAETLKKIMGAEGHLAKVAASRLTEGLPPGHPLALAAEAEKERSGDLAGLPDGHPLMVQLKDARLRHEESVRAAAGQGAPAPALRRARRIDQTKAFRERVEKEEGEKQRMLGSAAAINSAVDRCVLAFDEVLGVIGQETESFAGHPGHKARLLRLERLAGAARRGLVDGRISTVGLR